MPGRGAAWEMQLMRWHNDYRRRRLATIFRCHAGAKRFRGRMIFASEGPPDYTGVVNGRLIVFDAKEVSVGNTLPFSNIADHQGKDLTAVLECGGLPFLAIHFKEHRKYGIAMWDHDLSQRWTLWKIDKTQLKYGEKNIHVDHCLTFGAEGWLAIITEQLGK